MFILFKNIRYMYIHIFFIYIQRKHSSPDTYLLKSFNHKYHNACLLTGQSSILCFPGQSPAILPLFPLRGCPSPKAVVFRSKLMCIDKINVPLLGKWSSNVKGHDDGDLYDDDDDDGLAL